MDTAAGRQQLAAASPRLSRFDPAPAPSRPAQQVTEYSIAPVQVEQQRPARTGPIQGPRAQMRSQKAAADAEANSQIPLWVFRKALPQRFAEMAGGNDEFVFQ